MGKSYSVEEINKYINAMFQGDILLPNVSIRGEISNLKYHTTGHIYFSLKDENSAIGGVMFRSYASKLNLKLRDGMKVVVTGSIENYVRDGKYQIYARQIEDAGIGDLAVEFEELKRKLRAEGLFDETFKRPIPFYPHKIGIVTADTGAAIRDIISVTQRRNPYVQLVLYPAQVQGEGAADTIVEGIRALEKYGVDVMIVGRGGGSIEDLWAFNEEKVAYAIFESEVPVISAVGHEVDFTIADFVADVRAATPSAAAELAVKEIDTIINTIDEFKTDLDLQIDTILRNKMHEADLLYANLVRESPQNKIENRCLTLERMSDSLDFAIKRVLENKTNRQTLLAQKLSTLSPLERLKGGLAYVSHDGKRVSQAEDLKAGDEICLTMQGGKVTAEVKEINFTKGNKVD